MPHIGVSTQPQYNHFLKNNYFIYISASPANMQHACGSLGGQKRTSNALDLKLQVVATVWVLSIGPGSFARAAAVLNPTATYEALLRTYI